MEARVAKLEANVEHILADVTSMKGSVADARERLRGLEVKVDHLPSKGFIVSVVLVSLTIMAALVGYADTISSLLPGTITK